MPPSTGVRIGSGSAAATGPGWHEVPDAGTHAGADRGHRRAVAAQAPLDLGRVLPDADRTGRRGGAELLVRTPGGGYLPIIVVRHRITDPGAGALTTPLLRALAAPRATATPSAGCARTRGTCCGWPT